MHTRNLFFFCTILLLTSLNTYVMEEARKLSSPTKIIPISNNINAVLLRGSQLIIADYKGYTTIDIATDKTIQHKNPPCFNPITYQQHPTKAILSCQETGNYYAIIYDVKTKKQYVIPRAVAEIDKLQFVNLPGNTIMSTSISTKKKATTILYNYVTGTGEKYRLLNDTLAAYQDVNPVSITHNPTKQEVAFCNSKNEVHILDLITKECLQKIPLSRTPYNISYSCDGSSLRFTTEKGAVLEQHNLKIQSGKHATLPFLTCTPLACHPHHPYAVKATAGSYSESDSNVNFYWRFNYYNIKKNRKIAKYYILHNDESFEEKIFFPNNDFIALVTHSKCLILKTPFDTIKGRFYPLETKNKLILLYSLLKNYLLPDIVKILIQKTMKITKL